MEDIPLQTAHTAPFPKPPDKPNSDEAKKCIRFSIPAFINSFDRTLIRNANNLSTITLKKNFKSLMFSNYNFVCDIPNYFPCSNKTRNQTLLCYQCNFAGSINVCITSKLECECVGLDLIERTHLSTKLKPLSNYLVLFL